MSFRARWAVASVKLTFNNINEYEKDILTLTPKRILKKGKGKRTDKRENRSANDHGHIGVLSVSGVTC